VLSSNFVDHTHPALNPGPEDVKREVRTFRAAFPDACATIEDIISEGDRVAQAAWLKMKVIPQSEILASIPHITHLHLSIFAYEVQLPWRKKRYLRLA
jgi:predicted ester cyclase